MRGTCLGGEPNPRKEQILHRPQGGWTIWTRRWSNSLKPPGSHSNVRLERWGTRRHRSRHPKGLRPGRRFHRTLRTSGWTRIGSRGVLLRADIGAPASSASCRVRWVPAGLGLVSCPAGRWSLRAVGLRCAAALVARGAVAWPGNGSRCSSAPVASRRCSLGQPGEEPSGAPWDSSCELGRPRGRPVSRSRSRDRAGLGGNPGADPNGATAHRNRAARPVHLSFRSIWPPGNRWSGVVGSTGVLVGLRGRSNGKRAQAAVMRYGCRRGGSLRRELRRRKPCARPDLIPSERAARKGSPDERARNDRCGANAANPRSGTGCNMPELRPGGTRRGGEKPRGRNESVAWQPPAEARRRASGASGSGRAAGNTEEGRTQEGREVSGEARAVLSSGRATGLTERTPNGSGSHAGDDATGEAVS